MSQFFDDSMDDILANMPTYAIPDLFEDDSMDGHLARMDIPDFFTEDSLDPWLAKMDIPDTFTEDSMDAWLAKMDIPDIFDNDSMDGHIMRMADSDFFQLGGHVDEPSTSNKRSKSSSPTIAELIFNVALDRRMKPLVSRNLNAQEDTFVYHLDHNLDEYLEGIKNRDVDSFAAIGKKIDAMFASLVEPHLKKLDKGDYISVQVSHENLDRDIYVNWSFRDNFKATTFLDKISQMAQSDKAVFLNSGKLDIKITQYKGLMGSGKGRGSMSTRVPVEKKTYHRNKKSVAFIPNNDHTCGYLAITLGKILADEPNIKETKGDYWRNLRRAGRSQLKDLMTTLFQQLEIDTSTPVDEAKLRLIQSKLPEYQLVVVPSPTMSVESKSVMFSGDYKNKRIVLEFMRDEEFPNGHFNLVQSVTGLYECHFWCFKCWKGYDNAGSHRCEIGCKRCGSEQACIAGIQDLSCISCHMTFFGPACLEAHKSTCQKAEKCKLCDVIYRKDKRRRHECDMSFCQLCKTSYKVSPHFCYINPLDLAKLENEDTRNKIIVSFDIETRVAEVDAKGFSILKPNLLISHTVCDRCYDYENGTKKIDDCKTCRKLENIYFGDDCVSQFIDYVCKDLSAEATKPERDEITGEVIKKQREDMDAYRSKIFVYAHNLKGFDGRFILRDLWQRKFQGLEHVFAGSKILKIDVGVVRFLDSVSFLQMPLASVAKAFSLPNQKGDFPHHANKPENYDYIGPYFPLQDYSVEFMKKEKKNEFMTWHQSMVDSGAIFNFKQEFIGYCRNDVKILLGAIMSFRKLFKEVARTDPTTRNFTLAAVGQETYRSQLMSKPIGIVPAGGYEQTRTTSLGESLWLDWIQKTQGIKIDRQQFRGPYVADGWHEDTNTVYEFNGCFYHGCPTCHPLNRDESIYNQDSNSHVTHNFLYKKYQEKKEYYRKRGFNLIEIWEHDFAEQVSVSGDPYFNQRTSQLAKLKTLPKSVIRSSLFGGRTNNFKFQYDTTGKNEKLLYVDFTSLYPFVLKCREYPCGHPNVITENFKDVNEYFGFVTCRVQPPKQHYLPCLPVKANGKLLFPLCLACAAAQTNNFCTHEPKERAIEGTWTTPELQKAVSEGYVIEEIFLVHDYKENSVANEDQEPMFAKYINLWLRIKQESSGFPGWVKTEEDKDDYIRQYEAKEGIKLEKSSITKNPGLRSIAKLMLNSFWGKLAQRPNMPQTEIVTSHKKLMELLNDEKIKITGDQLINEDACLISYEYEDVEDSRVGKTSPAIASFVTSYGRLCLFDLMKEIEGEREGRLLYCDTDSAVFVHREGDKEIETGDFLGELTDEFASDYPGFTCYKGFFCGPKSYMLLLSKQEGDQVIHKTISKFKGLTLSSATDNTMTPGTIESLIGTYISNPSADQPRVSVKQQGFSALKFEQIMRRREFVKDFRVTSDKRIIVGNDTFPHGYVLSQ